MRAAAPAPPAAGWARESVREGVRRLDPEMPPVPAEHSRTSNGFRNRLAREVTFSFLLWVRLMRAHWNTRGIRKMRIRSYGLLSQVLLQLGVQQRLDVGLIQVRFGNHA